MRLRFGLFSLAFYMAMHIASAAHAALLITDSADPVEARHVEVELNGSYAHDKSTSNGITTKTDSTDGDITLTAGLAKGLDASTTLPYTFRSKQEINSTTTKVDGFNDITIDFKYQLLELDGLKLAIKPGAILPAGKSSEGLSDGKFGFSAALLATREFADGKIAVHTNAGYERHNYKDPAVNDASRSDIYSFSIAGEFEVADGLKLGLDTGLATNADKTSHTPPAYALGGATYELGKLLDIYVGAKFGLTRPEADLTSLFGAKLKF
jgi:hypothetical protein